MVVFLLWLLQWKNWLMDYSKSALAVRSRHLPKRTSSGSPEIREHAYGLVRLSISVMHILYTYSNVLDQHIQSKIISHIDMSELPMKSIN